MIVTIALVLLLTFGLGRSLNWILPGSIIGRQRVVYSNVGSVVLISAIVATVASTLDDPILVFFVDLGLIVLCQLVWVWRDLRKLSAASMSHEPAN